MARRSAYRDLPSAKVAAAVRKIEDRPSSAWGRQEQPIPAHQGARLLAPFGMQSKPIRLGEATPRGEEQDAFLDAWTRSLPLRSATAPQARTDAGCKPARSATPTDPPSATTPQARTDAGKSSNSSATLSNGTTVADADGRNPLRQADCGGVADREGKPVADGTSRNPASHNDCGGVAGHTPVP